MGDNTAILPKNYRGGVTDRAPGNQIGDAAANDVEPELDDTALHETEFDEAEFDDAELDEAEFDDHQRGGAAPGGSGPRRRQGGLAGAALGAAMFGLDQVLGRKPREEAPIVVDASGQPKDLEDDGVRVPIDDASSVWAPPQPRSEPPSRRRRRRRA
jgi:ferric-dicitrate binding protein FerR (iron transport regulator)